MQYGVIASVNDLENAPDKIGSLPAICVSLETQYCLIHTQGALDEEIDLQILDSITISTL